MSKPSQVILLVEDRRHQQFIRKYLRRLGLEAHAMRFEIAPSGVGSAESWVRERFPLEVTAYRRRQPQTRLIVLIDADAHTVQQRIRQLDQSLREADVAAIDQGTEHIARLVPKRNIETWILCLNQEAVDEDTDYKRPRNDWSDLIASGSDTLYQWTRPNAAIPLSCIESLQNGIQELQKLPF
jgi:hypothetical protein